MNINKDKCYICNRPTPESKWTVSGKPGDHKLCPDCLLKNMSAFTGARLMIAAYDAGYSSIADWKAAGCPK